MDIYTELILDHYKNPRNYGEIKNFDSYAKEYNPICGDEVEIYLKLEKDKIEEIKFLGKGCVISQASASILTEICKNKKLKDVVDLDKNFILKILKVDLNPNRVKCALLPLKALKIAIYKKLGKDEEKRD